MRASRYRAGDCSRMVSSTEALCCGDVPFSLGRLSGGNSKTVPPGVLQAIKKARRIGLFLLLFVWWRGGGSNSRPPHCERGALPAELPPQRSGNYIGSGADVKNKQCRCSLGPGRRGAGAGMCGFPSGSGASMVVSAAACGTVKFAPGGPLNLFIPAAAILCWRPGRPAVVGEMEFS